MKLSFLIALISLIQYGVPVFSHQPMGRQIPHNQGITKTNCAQQDGKARKAKENHRISVAAMPAGGQRSAEQAAPETDQSRENIEIQRKLVIATIALVIVGILQAGVLVWQAIALSRTLKAIQRQVEMQVKIERPWILASIEEMPHTQAIGGRDVIFVRCTIKNVGKTPAWIIAWTSIAKDIETDVLDPEPTYRDAKASIPQVLPPGDTLRSLLGWLRERFEEAHRDNLFLYVFGFVSYKDGFGDPHETRFCFRYYPPFRDNKMQGWHVGGPPAYNRQT